MSRAGSSGDALVVKPTNNVYTVLTAVAFLAAALAVLVVLMKRPERTKVEWWDTVT